MKKNYFLLIVVLISLASFSQTISIVQEQSSYYKKFNFKYDSQWDSLSAIENNATQTKPILKTQKTTSSSCSLTKKVYGWHPYWLGSVYNNYSWNLISDFCYFDYQVNTSTGANDNTAFDWINSAAVTTAKTNSVNIHFCATMFSNHASFLANSAAQQTFITNAINLLNARGGNGINIDFELMTANEKVPFKNFIINLSTQLRSANPNYKLSIALPAVEWSSIFDIPALMPAVDDFIIMGYDYYYSGSPQAGPTAPLYNFQTGYNYTLSKSITYYLKQGVSANKLLLGLPYYGREWATNSNTIPSNTTGGFSGSRLYNFVKNNPTTYSSTNKNWDANSFTPYYTYQASGVWRQCWIDDEYSMSRKFDLVNQRGIAGIGIWALGYDDGYQDFWRAIRTKFSTCKIVACTDSIFDIGGPNRNYYDNESYEHTITPTGAGKVQLLFGQMDLEQGADSLYVFDGSSVGSALIGAYTGTNIPSVINSTGASLTLRFKSNTSVTKKGFKAVWSCTQETVTPTTQVVISTPWITQNFSATFNDVDNIGGSGIDNGFYQPVYFNGIEWRSNGTRGFFNDDFNTNNLNTDWTAATGTWTNNSGKLVQTDETLTNTNIYASVAQNLSDCYLYNFKGTISGNGTSRRAGIHIFCDNATQTNRGNNYLIWMRPDQNIIELYKNTTNVLNVVKTVTFTIAVNTTYDYKITFNKTTGELKLWINNSFITSWTDLNPITTGNAISFRSGGCSFKIDDFKVFRSRSNSSNILVGTTNANDLRNENILPNISAGKINSVTHDYANNMSSITTQTINVDWTKPNVSNIVTKDGLSNDIDTTYNGTQLSLNYTAAKDTNSGITTYYYAIGTAPGLKDITSWTANASNLSGIRTGLSLSDNQKYYIMVKAINGAGLSSDSVISDGVLYLAGFTGNEENELLNSLVVYPNPTTDKAILTLISSTNNNVNYCLLDLQGKLIEQKELMIINGINTIELNLNELKLSKGIYFINLLINEKIIIKKLVVN